MVTAGIRANPPSSGYTANGGATLPAQREVEIEALGLEKGSHKAF